VLGGVHLINSIADSIASKTCTNTGHEIAVGDLLMSREMGFLVSIWAEKKSGSIFFFG